MPPIHVTLPTGLAGTVRGLRMSEQRILSDKHLASKGRTTRSLLEACWESTSEPGPYKLGTDGKPDWLKVYTGDVEVAIMAIRRATFGEHFDFTFTCDECDKKTDYRLHLGKDLAIRPLSDDAREAFTAGKHFDVEGPSGEKVVFRLLDGAGQEALIRRLAAQKVPEGDSLIHAAAERIVSVDSVTDRDKIVAWFTDLGLAEASDLIEAMDAHGGGNDTAATLACEHCDADNAVTIPLDGRVWSRPKQHKTR